MALMPKEVMAYLTKAIVTGILVNDTYLEPVNAYLTQTPLHD